MPTVLSALNKQTAIVDGNGKPTRYFGQFLQTRDDRLVATAAALPSQAVSLDAQGAAIAATALVASTDVDLYRISYALRISQAAGATSAATLTIGWTQGGVAQTRSGANVNGNTTTSKDADAFLIRPDAGTVVTYAVSYASTGVPDMQYEVDVVAESLG